MQRYNWLSRLACGGPRGIAAALGSLAFLHWPRGTRLVEPFSILCTTCQTRLRVRDSSAIGQILACPKCGSMVMVQAPAGHEPAAQTGAAAGEGAVLESPG